MLITLGVFSVNLVLAELHNENVTAINDNIEVFTPYLSSSDGCGRTGTFLSIYSQVERLKTEQVIDVFQWVKSARIQRAWLVSNQVKIIFTYNLIQIHS